jgi:hypothetical protein
LGCDDAASGIATASAANGSAFFQLVMLILLFADRCRPMPRQSIRGVTFAATPADGQRSGSRGLVTAARVLLAGDQTRSNFRFWSDRN